VIISNLPLLIPLAIACVSALWSAWEKSSARHLIWAGVFLGLGILSDLFAMALVPGFVIVAAILLWRKHDRREVGLVTLAAGLGALLVIPWIIFNEVHVHAVTAQSVVEALQGSAVNPHHVHYSLGFAAFQIVATLFQPVPPQDVAFGNHGVLLWLAQMLGVFLIPVPLVLGVSMGRRLFDGGTWMLALPFVAAVALCVGFTVGEQWLSMVPRYTYLGLPLLALFLAAAALGVLRDLRPYLVTVCGFAVFLAVLWIVLVPHIRAA
jgi:4-amino-4-deoxy-L-arabinose transferase-like glycosyltransferase